MAENIDRYIAAKWLKGKVDGLCKEAEADMSAELSELNETTGAIDIGSKLFEGAHFAYSKTRAKNVTEYNLSDALAFADWLIENPEACNAYAQYNAEAFGKWWFEHTGEVPDGVSRVEYRQEARIGAPKLYGYDGAAVEQVIRENRLLDGIGGYLIGGTE